MTKTRSKLTTEKRALKILELLKQEYPDAACALNYENAFHLLIATILSAQCTDARVNLVTGTLFKKYKTPKDFIRVSQEELEKDIFSTGFYKQKAKSIKSCCQVLIDKHHGEVPKDFDLLVTLPGIGRKTASVVVGNAFGTPAIAVDTHVKRLSNLLGLVDSDDPDSIEARLKEIFPPDEWILLSHRLATHGRNVCIARRPKCDNCILNDYCPSRSNSDE